MMGLDEVAGWRSELAAVAARIAPRFSRVAARRRASAYLSGLLLPLERKTSWQMAEAAGDATPDGMQDFLSRARWDADAVRDDLQRYVVEHLGDPGAVLVLDETGFLKKGTRSVGVKRQYSGTAGRIENCQVGVFLGYASPRGRALLDRALYLPQEWAADEVRRREAWVPDAVSFATKPMLGLAMVRRARDAGVPFAWVAADSVYGADHRLRRWLEEAGTSYVLTVTSAQRSPVRYEQVCDTADRFTAADWHRLSAGDGAKGPRLYDWAFAPGVYAPRDGWRRGVLVRRSLGDPSERTHYLTFAPDDTPLAQLVRIAGSRWTIEACFEAAKGEVGLDRYEVRTWTGWHRHITLSMLALAFLTVLRKTAIGGSGPGIAERRASAPDRPRNPPPAPSPRLCPAFRSRRRPRLVPLASTPSATRPAVSLEPPNHPTVRSRL